MHSSMRLLRFLLLALLTVAVLSLAMALLTAETGLAEKVVLVAVIAGCVYVAAQVPTLVARLDARLHRA